MIQSSSKNAFFSLKKKIVVLILMMCVSSAHASDLAITENTSDRVIIQGDVSYTLGDADTKITARNMVIETARRRAAEMAGTYIESELVMTDGAITREQHHQITAAFVQCENLDERLTVSENNQPRLTLSLRLSIDKSSLQQKIRKLQGNAESQAQIKRLIAEKESLRQELADINQKFEHLKKQVDDKGKHSMRAAAYRKSLVQKRNTILFNLEKTDSKIRKTFDRGTLFTLAKASNLAYERSIRDVDEILDFIKHNTRIILGDPQVSLNSDGTYHIQIDVTWKIPRHDVIQQFNRLFETLPEFRPNGTVVNTVGMRIYQPYTNIFMYPKSKSLNDKRIFKYLNTKEIQLVVSAGRKKGAYCIGKKDGERFKFIYNSRKLSDYDGFLIIENISADNLKTITEVSVQIEIGERVTPRMRKKKRMERYSQY